MNVGRQGAGSVRWLLAYLTVTDLNHGAIAWDAIDNDEEECGTRCQDGRVGGYLSDVQGDGSVTVDGVCVIELKMSLTHVHRVCREPATRQNDSGIGSRAIRGPRVRAG